MFGFFDSLVEGLLTFQVGNKAFLMEPQIDHKSFDHLAHNLGVVIDILQHLFFFIPLFIMNFIFLFHSFDYFLYLMFPLQKRELELRIRFLRVPPFETSEKILIAQGQHTPFVQFLKESSLPLKGWTFLVVLFGFCFFDLLLEENMIAALVGKDCSERMRAILMPYSKVHP